MLWALFVVNLLFSIVVSTGARSNTEDPIAHHILLDSVGFGTAGLRGKTHEAVLEALNLGVRMIDSAQATEWYDEKGVGSAVAEFLAKNPEVSGEEIILITKVHPRTYDFESMNRKLEESKENFGVSHLDVVLLHAPWCWSGHCTPEQEAVGWETGWRNLVALKEKHHIKAIGVSNFDINLLTKLVVEMGAEVDVVQNWMDPFHQDHEVRVFCMHHGIQYMAYSSFGTQWNRNPNPVLTNPALLEIAEFHEATVPRVIMTWLNTEGVIAIPRTANVDHMRDNFAQLILHRAARQQCAAIDAAGGELPLTCDEGYSHADWHLTYNELEAIRYLDGTLGSPWDER